MQNSQPSETAMKCQHKVMQATFQLPSPTHLCFCSLLLSSLPLILFPLISFFFYSSSSLSTPLISPVPFSLSPPSSFLLPNPFPPLFLFPKSAVRWSGLSWARLGWPRLLCVVLWCVVLRWVLLGCCASQMIYSCPNPSPPEPGV